MRRIVITGMGIVSSLGNDLGSVLHSLQTGRSGIRHNPSYAELGFRSQISGSLSADTQAIDRKLRRFMSDAAAFAWLAAEQAIAQAQLTPAQLHSERTGLIAGSGGASCQSQTEALDALREKGVKRIGPYMVPRIMASTISANLATGLGIRGLNYSIASACATSAHCIGHAADLIRSGLLDVALAGGGEEEHWSQTMMFDAMGALSTRRNGTPEQASRPFDADRDGFVISGGGGMLVLEALEHAEQRGAPILAELVGYAATSDGADMVAPSGEGAERCMRTALRNLTVPIDYINAHGTSTPVGDIAELNAIQRVFSEQAPPVTSTKSLSGHAMGAAGVHEAIYSLLMLQHGFIAGTANLDHPDPGITGMPLPGPGVHHQPLHTVLSNSFGFGGTNATLVLQRLVR